MDVHAPHEPIHSWRDFVLHLLTITVGLLIALGLEASVEALHHRSERLETLRNLREEITENRQTLAKNLRAIAVEKQMLETDIATLRQLRDHKAPQPRPLRFDWYWNSMGDSAWQTARETTAIALFPSDQVQTYTDTYGQQSLSNEAGIALSHSITAAAIPLTVQPDLSQLTPAQIDELMRNCAAALNQIDYLGALNKSLDPEYEDVLRKF